MIFLDANIIIYALKPDNKHLIELIDTTKEDFACSDIVRLEVLGFQGLGQAEKSSLQKFLDALIIQPVTGDIIDRAITIRQQKAIKSPDAIIAATAMLAKQSLWTSNVKDFGRIKNLDWYNPLVRT